MRPALDDFDDSTLDAIYKTVIFIDAAAPVTGKIAPERLWLAKTLIAVAVNIFQKLEDTLEGLAVLFCPILEVFPGFI